jgi:hypothetical protein
MVGVRPVPVQPYLTVNLVSPDITDPDRDATSVIPPVVPVKVETQISVPCVTVATSKT